MQDAAEGATVRGGQGCGRGGKAMGGGRGKGKGAAKLADESVVWLPLFVLMAKTWKKRRLMHVRL